VARALHHRRLRRRNNQEGEPTMRNRKPFITAVLVILMPAAALADLT
jgi:hypothetical protein